MDDDQLEEEEEENEPVGEMSTACSQLVLKFLFLDRIGRLDILWSVNKLARAVTKWTNACDNRLARLISYIHHTRIQAILSCGKNSTKGAGLDYFKILILQEISMTQNQHQVDSSTASSPIASKSPGMPIASGRPDSRMSVEPSSFDAASTSQVRLKDAYLGGLMEEQR